jgi:hypothetical protein
MPRRWCLAATVAASLVRSGWVEAQTLPGIDLRWKAPATCPSVGDVGARVRRLLGQEAPSGAQTTHLIVDGTVTRVSGRYRLDLTVRQEGKSAEAARVYESDSCESLAGAGAVTVALLARAAGSRGVSAPTPASPSLPAPSALKSHTPPSPSGMSAPSAGAPAGPHNAVSPASSPPSSPSAARQETRPPAEPAISPTADHEMTERPLSSPPPDTTAPPARTLRARSWFAVLDAPLFVSDDGVLPSWTFGAGVKAGARVGRLELLLAATLWLPQNDGAPSLTSNAGSYEAHYGRRSGSVEGCYAWPVGRFDFDPCLSFTLESVTARGAGPEVAVQSGQALWLAVVLGARARWAATPWSALFIEPHVAVDTARPIFTIDGVGSLYRAPLATVGIDLGTEWIL